MAFSTGAGLGIVEAGAVASLELPVSVNDQVPANVPQKKSGGSQVRRLNSTTSSPLESHFPLTHPGGQKNTFWGVCGHGRTISGYPP